MLVTTIETKCMYSIEHNKVLIALVATSFGRYDYNQANAVQNANGWLHVVHQNVKLYGIPRTSMSVLVNRLKVLLTYDVTYRGSDR